MKLKDKKAIETGASAGIGEATTLLFTKEGVKVLFLVLNEFSTGISLSIDGGMSL